MDEQTTKDNHENLKRAAMTASYGNIKGVSVDDITVEGVMLPRKLITVHSGPVDQDFFVSYSLSQESADELVKALRAIRWPRRKSQALKPVEAAPARQ